VRTGNDLRDSGDVWVVMIDLNGWRAVRRCGPSGA
jgi:hypothetical protein